MNTGAGQAIRAMYGQAAGGMAPAQGSSGGGSNVAPGSPFVDQIEDNVATLMMPDGSTKQVSAASLPPGAKEGTFLDGSEQPNAQANMYRNQQVQGDQRGPIKL